MKLLRRENRNTIFGGLIDTARVALVVLEEEHRRRVVAVLSIEEYERLKAIDSKKEAA